MRNIPLAQPTVETPLTQDSEEAETPLQGDADDPAIWVHPNNPDQSLVIATLKDGGAVVFDLQGEIQQTITPADVDESFEFGDIRYNNVDLIYNVDLPSQLAGSSNPTDLAVFSDRANDTLAIFGINPNNGELFNLTAPTLSDSDFSIFGVDDGEATAYGLATYTSPVSGKSYAFVTQADGNQVAQLELLPQIGPADEISVDAEVVRVIDLPVPTGDPADSQSEGLVVDEELGFMYVALEEEVGILKFSAEPDAGNDFQIIQPLSEPPELTPEPFSSLITFGDSSVDVGNVFLGTSLNQPPSPPYFEGRFSNESVFVELIAEELGLSASSPFLAGGNNYAFGGAELGDGTSSQQTPNLGEQIDLFLGGNNPSEDDLFFISAGNNNFLAPLAVGENLPEVENLIDLLVDDITTLANAGGENFVVTNLPPLGSAPIISNPVVAESLNAAISEYNALLDPELDSLESELGIEIYEIDLEGIIQEIINDPAAFGLTNITDAALNLNNGNPYAGFSEPNLVPDSSDFNIVENPNEFLFWDDLHPTATVGEIVAENGLEVIPEGLDQLTTGEAAPLIPNLEGLDIYYGADGTGYLVANSQGDSSYAVFSREGSNEYLGSFAVGDNGDIDQVNESDGLDITNVNLGSAFPEGLVVFQDGVNDPQNPVPDEEELENNSTNFKFVPWDDIANRFDNPLDIDPTSFDPRNPANLISESEPTNLRFGGLSDDVIETTGDNEIAFTGAGNDLVDASVSNGGNRLYGGADNDELLASSNDRLYGGTGDDRLDASAGGGENRLYGGLGNDDFFAGSNDRLLGGEGSDRVFIFTGGDNLITGGADADQFWIANAQFSATANTITDFTIGEDVLGIGGISDITEFADLTLIQEGTHTLISSGENELAQLLGINASDLTADQFVIQDEVLVALS
ncbi:phytase [Halothece sp. PCC 7418]|uniref:phytase n=1 Tax=Halothece sp. (strain PCC 7418) TaxID=65093 RepID=UPI0002A05A78|nr:phytase [Halothece sp. PCC 7418]AFZ44822.1 phytase [Halothece sp. PCC 7418]